MNERIQEQEINIIECFEAWLKHRQLVAKTTGIFVVLALIYVFLASPVYQAVSTIWVRQDKGIAASILENSLVGGNNTQLANTYMEIFKAQEVMNPVLAKYPQYGNVDDLRNAVTLNIIRNTNLFSIAVNNKDPELAKEINDALVNSFLEHLSSIDRQQYSDARHFLDMRVKEFRENLFKAEDNLQDFQKSHKIASPDSTVDMVLSRLSSMDKMKVDNRINLEIANAKVAVAEKQMRGKDLRVIADSNTLKKLREELAELEKQRIRAATRYTVKHPMLIRLNNDIRNLRNKIEQEITRVANMDIPPTGLYATIFEDKLKNEAEAKVAQSNLDSLDKLEADFKTDIDKLSDSNKEHLRLLRDVTVTQEIYTILAKRLEEAKVAEVSASQEARIASRAMVPIRPIAPRKARTLAAAMFVGFFLSSAFVVMMELMNRTIVTTDDVAKYLDLPMMGVVPDFDLMQKHMNSDGKEENNSKQSFLRKAGDFLWRKK